MATAHDERMKEFNRFVDAAARMLKVQHAARKAAEEETESKEEKGTTVNR